MNEFLEFLIHFLGLIGCFVVGFGFGMQERPTEEQEKKIQSLIDNAANAQARYEERQRAYEAERAMRVAEFDKAIKLILETASGSKAVNHE